MVDRYVVMKTDRQIYKLQTNLRNVDRQTDLQKGIQTDRQTYR